jgi:DNA-binding NtrC family response regulator
MPARVVVVHDDPLFIEQVTTALRDRGLTVAVFEDPMKALDGLETAQLIELLITRVQFAPGKPNGISLALMARTKRPGMKVLLVALPEFARLAAGIGEFMPAPINVPDLVVAAERLLQADG